MSPPLAPLAVALILTISWRSWVLIDVCLAELICSNYIQRKPFLVLQVVVAVLLGVQWPLVLMLKKLSVETFAFRFSGRKDSLMLH